MKRTIIRLFAAFSATLLAACASVTMTDEEAKKWIAAYAPSQIDISDDICILPTDSLLAHLDASKLKDDVFSFSPSLKGTVVYDTCTACIRFKPKEGELKQGKKYFCRMDMSSLTGIDSLRDFSFEFYVEKRETKIADMSLHLDADSAGSVVVEGFLLLSRKPEANGIVNTALLCSVPGSKVKITPTNDKKRFAFTVYGIPRRLDDYDAELFFVPDNSFSPSKASFTIPGLSGFDVLSVKLCDVAQPYINIEFTSPLDESQELDGLVAIDEMENVKIERRGASVKVFFQRGGLKNFTLHLSELIRSAEGKTLKSEVVQTLSQDLIPPAVEVPVSGTILPNNGDLKLPFRAVNLAAVDVEVVKIYADNVLRFLQINDIDDNYSLRRWGTLIYRQTVRLDGDKSLNLHDWQNFSIDLKNLFRRERGAIYSVRLSFRKAYSLYGREKAEDFELLSGITEQDRQYWEENHEYSRRYNRPGDNYGYFDWSSANDPESDSYYSYYARVVDYNLAASNIGLILKRSEDNKFLCAVTDILSAAPLGGITLKAYNFQQRVIGSAVTDSQGFAVLSLQNVPEIIVATDGVSTTYLKIDGRTELSAEAFDVSGTQNKKGIKAFIYGERGVWRPGDDIYLTLMVEDKLKSLPANHPVTVELVSPSGQVFESKAITQSAPGIYVYHTATAEDAETGYWQARFKVGGQTFKHSVRIETVKPNRLKIKINIPEMLYASGKKNKVGMEVNWLSGAVASGLKAKLEMSLYEISTPFEQHKNYVFTNPLVSFSDYENTILESTLDSAGKLAEDVAIPYSETAPGLMRANIVARVQEAGGDESVTAESVRFSPYRSYVGIDLGSRQFETGRDLTFNVLNVDENGKPSDTSALEYQIYKIEWSMWYEGSAYEYSRYVQGCYSQPVASGKLKTVGGKAAVKFKVENEDCGRYLIYVQNMASNHASGGEIFVDWADWNGLSNTDDPTHATMLPFSLDKANYEPGETATILFPKSPGGRVLVSVENGYRVIRHFWTNLVAEKETALKLPVTADMAPNFYVHATLLQPHSQTVNDLPIRMYGIHGALVYDKKSVLHPVITVADEVQPQQEFAVRVSEKDGKKMSYTLAIVDEGLLDLTAFRTPNPWAAMNQREALGVKTWDMYDDVIGAYAGVFKPILSVGGDMALRKASGMEKRFNPVVKFLGPFTVSGGSKVHKIKLPMYVGSVRVMVVATNGTGGYGSEDKTVTVASPLMLLPSLPRTLSCGDRVSLPVNVFVSDATAKNVVVSVKAEGSVKVAGAGTKNVAFSGKGEKLVNFDLLCDKSREGKAKIFISASSGSRTFRDTVFIDVKNPNPVITKCISKTISGGKSAVLSVNTGIGSDCKLEVATMPTINFSGVFGFVKNYSHFCTEQLSARAMFLLYCRNFLSAEEQLQAEQALPEILRCLMSRQLASGGFAYWSDTEEAHPWVSSMAGLVMCEARRQGFFVDESSISRWKENQKKEARNYRHSTVFSEDLVQAYRLYSLVLAGETPTAAMNKLRESKSVSRSALFCLSAAYSVAGKRDAALSLLERAVNTHNTPGNYDTFYTPLRDTALELLSFSLAGEKSRATEVAIRMVKDFNPQNCVTQEVAFVSMAVKSMAEIADRRPCDVKVTEKGKTPQVYKNLSGTKVLTVSGNTENVTVENCGKTDIFVSLLATHRPAAGEPVPACSSGVVLSVKYVDRSGKEIAVSRLKQGDEFIARISVKKSEGDSESMALTFAVPSGWEIWNDRLIGNGSGERYDIYDDRICLYFPAKIWEKHEFSVRLRAAWCGKYVFPAVVCEDMYDAKCKAVLPNTFVEVVK